ncbi:hypothetical protein R3P38DRAFT_3620533 [Favolaschia claudopus]|uniref:Uncharacterized protein n=1 Tax=Favolaschia claudopus TaxID=2862362 RepID=A0AAW0D9D0_9AGAR
MWDQILPFFADCVDLRKGLQHAQTDLSDYERMFKTARHTSLCTDAERERGDAPRARLKTVLDAKKADVKAAVDALNATSWWPVGLSGIMKTSTTSSSIAAQVSTPLNAADVTDLEQMRERTEKLNDHICDLRNDVVALGDSTGQLIVDEVEARMEACQPQNRALPPHPHPHPRLTPPSSRLPHPSPSISFSPQSTTPFAQSYSQ